MSEETVEIFDRTGSSVGRFEVLNQDPWFSLVNPDDKVLGARIEKGGSLRRAGESNKHGDRLIVGVSVFFYGIVGGLSILAPRAVSRPKPNQPYMKFRDLAGSVELRPGTTVLGGRDSGFYDAFGLILEARHIGGDPEKFEDWAYYVVGPSWGHELRPQWILLDHIGGVEASPDFILDLSAESDKTVEELLNAGERELFEYFARDSKRLENLNPNQFEQLVDSVYRNLGFSTERIGAWNQADGGVDILAISQSLAGPETRLAIQCKTSKNGVSARPIRELAGVLESARAHQGIVATTSWFTSKARAEVDGHLWRVSLQDGNDLYRKIIAVLMPNLPI